MATETTLGARILAAAEAYDMAASALRGRTTFPQEANASANAALAELRAMVARADAAERLAVALSPLGLHICDDEPGADEVNAAMEAWWVIEGKVQP